MTNCHVASDILSFNIPFAIRNLVLLVEHNYEARVVVDGRVLYLKINVFFFIYIDVKVPWICFESQ